MLRAPIDPQSEHYAARNQVATFDLSFRGFLRFTGEDRIDFLQGMITNDVKSLRPYEGVYAAFLTAKGSMISDLRALILEDSVLIDLNSDKIDPVFKTLNKYLISEDVEISDVSEKFGLISLQGPKSSDLINSILNSPLPELKNHAFVCQKVDSVDTIIVKTDYTKEDGFDLIASGDDLKSLWETLSESGERFGLKPAGLEALNVLRLEAGIPLFGIDMDESTIPSETPIESKAISYNKGCYIGQEIIARVKYRGRPNKFLVGLKFAGDRLPHHGDLLFKGEQQVGRVTSAAFSYSLSEKIGLGYVRRGFEEVGNELSLSDKNGVCIAKISELPFYRKERYDANQSSS